MAIICRWVALISILCVLVSSPSSSKSFPTHEELALLPVSFLNLARTPEVSEYMVRIRRRLHEYPELGFEEFETSKLIRAELDEMGIHYKHPLAVTGVVGYIGTGKPPFVALRADMDALAMEVCKSALISHFDVPLVGDFRLDMFVGAFGSELMVMMTYPCFCFLFWQCKSLWH